MRVLVVALAAALAGCATVPQQQPVQQQPVLPVVKAPPVIAGQPIAGQPIAGQPIIVEKPVRHHKRAGRSSKTEANAPQAERRSSGVVDAATAERIKAIVAAKLGNPAAIQFQDIEPGEIAGSFCGVAQVKGASGGTAETPFVVRGDQVYVINGSDDSKAAAAMHSMCDR
jgi:hypothetical protein